MQTKRGTGGQTQKEAIFRIFKQVLGERYYPGMDVKKVLCIKANTYGRAKWDSSFLNRIIIEIYEGLCSGAIPSKLNSNSEGHSERHLDNLRREYANRITHYWMKHDKRLNGSVSGSRMAMDRKRQIALEVRLNSDPMMKSMKAMLQEQEPNSALQFEIQTYLMGRLCRHLLETYGIDIDGLPLSVRETLKLDATKDNVGQHKVAA